MTGNATFRHLVTGSRRHALRTYAHALLVVALLWPVAPVAGSDADQARTKHCDWYNDYAGGLSGIKRFNEIQENMRRNPGLREKRELRKIFEEASKRLGIELIPGRELGEPFNLPESRVKAVLNVLYEDERLALSSSDKKGLAERLTRALTGHPTVGRTWEILTGLRRSGPNSQQKGPKGKWLVMSGKPAGQNLLPKLSKDEVMTMAVFSGYLGGVYPRSIKSFVLHDLVDNLGEMVEWPDETRELALALVTDISSWTQRRPKLGPEARLIGVLGNFLKVRSVGTVREIMLQSHQKCGDPSVFEEFRKMRDSRRQ